MGLQKVGWGGMDWMQLAQDTEWWREIVNAVMNLPSFIKCGKFLD
jgi:hypothetical protein